MTTSSPRLGILVGGGPAPGINGVIAAATIEARKRDLEVLGFYDGFKWLCRGQKEYEELQIRDVSRIHFKGGSILRTSREGSLKIEENLENTLRVLRELNVKYLVVIGGDGTAYSSYLLSRAAGGDVHVAHIPKTIDNDIPLPGMVSTFGFQTARHLGTELVENIMEDSSTVGRWYFMVTMGRKTGHLSLAIGKSSGATLTIIPEEFEGEKVSLDHIADILEMSIIKRLAMGHNHGVAILAEGLLDRLEEEDIKRLGKREKDPSGHIRFAELNLGVILKKELKRRLEEKGHEVTIVSKNLGYELRAAPPISFDKEYTRTLGYGAVKYLLQGKKGHMICLHKHKIIPLPLEELLEESGEAIRLRKVNTNTEWYEVAREYMIRLLDRDVEEGPFFKKLLTLTGMSRGEFLDRYGYLISS